MLIAWIICSTLLGLCGMFGELRKGESVATALTGFVCSFVLWPILIFWFLLCALIMCAYVVISNLFY